MSETVPERHYRDRVQSVRRLASLPESERAAMSWQDTKDLVTLCFDLGASGRDLIEKEYRRIFKDANLTVAWLQERRRVIEELSDSYIQLAHSVRTSAYQAWQAAGSPPDEDVVFVLDNAIHAIAEARNAVLQRWPVGGSQEIADARAAIARGETVDADEAFAEIAGTDVDTWRKSIEEYKRRG